MVLSVIFVFCLEHTHPLMSFLSHCAKYVLPRLVYASLQCREKGRHKLLQDGERHIGEMYMYIYIVHMYLLMIYDNVYII